MKPPKASASAVHQALEAALGPALGDQVFEWAFVTEPTWGREGWTRAQSARSFCAQLEKPAP